MLQQSTVENLLFPSDIIFLSSSLMMAVELKSYVSLVDRMYARKFIRQERGTPAQYPCCVGSASE